MSRRRTRAPGQGCRLLIAGGGTGGHFFPGQAVAEAFVARDAANEVLFVGTERGIEARLCPREGLALRTIAVQRLKGGGVKGWAAGLLALPRALGQARTVVREFDPDVVLGVGGYASGPVVLAAALAGRPTLVMEQNARPGLTNRLLGRVVRQVVVAMDEARPFFPAGRTVLLGNPVRARIREQLERVARAGDGAARDVAGPAHLLVVGGSQGARGINRILPPTLAALERRGVRPLVRHQTGKYDAASVRTEVERLGLVDRVELSEFIEEMAGAYGWADLVVCRAGAMTVSELAVAGRPSVLIPFPFAADNHQEANARSLVAAGGALMVREAELDAERLAETLQTLLADRARLATMGRAAAAVARPRAADDVVDRILALAGRGGADRSAPDAGEDA